MFYLLKKIPHFINMSRSLKVWSKFSGKTKDRAIVKLRLVDMPKNLHEEVLNVYLKYFVNEEAAFKAAGVPKSAEAIEELLKSLLQAVNEEEYHVVICCLDNSDDQIKDVIGASIMALLSKEDLKTEAYVKHGFETEEMKKLFEIIYRLEACYDEMKVFDLDSCFSDRGLFVRPEYRGLGIAQEFLKVRRMICKEHGIPINGGWMTSYGTQKAAERDGWETVFEIKCEELEKNHGVTFSKDPPTWKFMIARIQ